MLQQPDQEVHRQQDQPLVGGHPTFLSKRQNFGSRNKLPFLSEILKYHTANPDGRSDLCCQRGRIQTRDRYCLCLLRYRHRYNVCNGSSDQGLQQIHP